MGERLFVKIKELFECLLEILFPETCSCALCGRILKKYDIHHLCEHCISDIVILKEPFITINDLLHDSVIKSNGALLELSILSVCHYNGMPREMIHKLKYNGKTELAASMAVFISEVFLNNGFNYDLIVPVPSHSKRLKQRGYNQAALIAARLSEITGIPYTEVLCKIEDTKSQVLFNGKDRWYNVKDAFAVKSDFDDKKLKGLRILLLDDVITTGATVYYCSCELKKHGAAEITAASFART